MAERLARQVRGEALGKVLADFLNRHDQRTQRLRKRGVRIKNHRIVRFLEDLATLGQVPAMPRGPNRQELAFKLQDKLNRQLRSYLQFQQIRLDQDLRSFFVFETEGNAPFSEHMVVDAMGGLLREGLLQRMRRCLRCDRWYFAKKEDSKYCRGRCQTMTTEESREKKRAYMKGYYQLKNSGRVK
jgi:hypothetical protein